MKRIKDWNDLVGMENENYKIEVDLRYGSGWIKLKTIKMNLDIIYQLIHFMK